MKCTICGKGTAQGALLCRPCKAALKRARLLTVQELPHYKTRANAPVDRYGADTGPSKRTKALRRSEKVDNGGRMLLGAVAAIALVVAAYIAERELTSRAAVSRMPPALAAGVPQPTPLKGAAARDVAIQASAAHAAAAEPVPLAPRRSASTFPPLRAASATPASAPASATQRQDPAPAPAAVYPPIDSFGPLAEAPKPLPPPPLAVPRAPPPPDRWQVMSEALGRCANEGGFSGFICDQRVRLASCDGYWGRVAQCPNPPENPR